MVKAAYYLISHPQELKQVAANILKQSKNDLTAFAQKVIAGDPEALGQLSAELVLAVMPAGEAGTAGKAESAIAREILDNVVMQEGKAIVKVEQVVVKEAAEVVENATANVTKEAVESSSGVIIMPLKKLLQSYLSHLMQSLNRGESPLY